MKTVPNVGGIFSWFDVTNTMGYLIFVECLENRTCEVIHVRRGAATKCFEEHL
jgi:hypothetical protein